MKLALALLLSASAASAQELSLAVKSGDWAFALKLPATGSSKKEVVSQDGSARRTVIFNSNLTGSHLEYQIEIIRPDSKAPFQLQSAVDLPLGQPVELVRCGGVSIGVNAPGSSSKTIPENVLTKVEAAFGKDSGDCAIIVAPGSQANFVGNMLIGKNQKRLIFNEAVTGSPGAWNLQYQLQLAGPAWQGSMTPAENKRHPVGSRGGLSVWLRAALRKQIAGAASSDAQRRSP